VLISGTYETSTNSETGNTHREATPWFTVGFEQKVTERHRQNCSPTVKREKQEGGPTPWFKAGLSRK